MTKLNRFTKRLRAEITIPVLFALYVGLFVVRPHIADGPGTASWWLANLAGFLPPVACGYVLRGLQHRIWHDNLKPRDT